MLVLESRRLTLTQKVNTTKHVLMSLCACVLVRRACVNVFVCVCFGAMFMCMHAGYMTQLFPVLTLTSCGK